MVDYNILIPALFAVTHRNCICSQSGRSRTLTAQLWFSEEKKYLKQRISSMAIFAVCTIDCC